MSDTTNPTGWPDPKREAMQAYAAACAVRDEYARPWSSLSAGEMGECFATGMRSMGWLPAAEVAAQIAEAVAQEREKCAALFDNLHDRGRIIVGRVNLSCAEARHIAATIRARSTT